MTMNIGIIGTGNFAKMHAEILMKMKEVKVQAICGTTYWKAEKLAIALGATKAYDDVKNMLDGEALDAVYICVPPMAHGTIEMELVERGVPFFIEKPLGTDLVAPSEIVTAVEKQGLVTSVGYHFRYKQSSKQVKEIIREQKVGIVSGQWMGSMPMVDWWRRQEGSGGQFIEQTTHIVDLLRFTVGEVDEVYALYNQQLMHEKVENVTVADVGTVTLKLKSGVIATIANTCILPDHTFRAGLSIYTDQGFIDWTPDSTYVNIGGTQTTVKDEVNPYIAENDAFIYALRTGDTSRIESDYRDAWRTQAVTTAALQSASLVLPVKV
ncbi:Gfo/Idh/MocA family protein [Halalkalibacter urbisdiaboli]|uniref:Gfo/Idh/MocA family protein n=1 Tax=Halalkalibacter urbisdiaboli TaxID=1960589 RepID=UPI000B44ABB6|nr:Gfo/Idh/MocA family oxidoreductase [Halalkalibacter urbisdiaboli]